jgi:diaminopimelate decarboxylase
MSDFIYKDGQLFAEDVSLLEIAEQYNTPCYVYSNNTIQSRYLEFDSAFTSGHHLLCYAVKANSNISILNALARLGSGFDIVSIGELLRVLEAGGDPMKVVFSGVGKREDEMKFALEQNIKCFNVESESELLKLNRVAENMGMVAPVSLRVNPDVDAKTHPYIATGLKENKFGIAFESAKVIYEQAANMSNISLIGIGCHIGSQISSLTPFQDALQRLLDLIDELKQLGIELQHVDIGGGLGITYQNEIPPTPTEYVNAVTSITQKRDLEVIIEPGRSIVGNAGILLTKVEYLNITPFRNFAVIDAAMNDLIRPSLYDSWHEIKCVMQNSNIKESIYDVVGPICETGDFIGKNRSLSLSEGDLLAIFSAGAYGFSMSSNYNSRPRAAEILVDGVKVHEVRRREKLEDLFGGELLP